MPDEELDIVCVSVHVLSDISRLKSTVNAKSSVDMEVPLPFNILF